PCEGSSVVRPDYPIRGRHGARGSVCPGRGWTTGLGDATEGPMATPGRPATVRAMRGSRLAVCVVTLALFAGCASLTGKHITNTSARSDPTYPPQTTKAPKRGDEVNNTAPFDEAAPKMVTAKSTALTKGEFCVPDFCRPKAA